MARKRYAHYTPRVCKRICDRIADGMSLMKALDKEGELAPDHTTWRRWCKQHPELQVAYEAARIVAADRYADRHLELADEVIKYPKDAHAYKVAAEILIKQAEMRNPAKYGHRVQVEHTHTLDATQLIQEIRQLESELGLLADESNVVDVDAKEIPE